MTNMLVMLGAMFVQPLIGRILDWSYSSQHVAEKMKMIAVDGQNLRLLYSAHDYQLAMSVIPAGIVIAAILTFFLRETHAHAKHNKS